ncbi:hypothetical protein B0H14DRAFT_2585474 [Mycena olivaceomarginata]|nr:hypothetical protein B0H14DRAFT_2585474 [Mycena olivaceomarginata]
MARHSPARQNIEGEPFTENENLPYDDESDVPLEVLINHVQSGGTAAVPDGFAVDDEGNLARNGTVEDTELDVVADDLPLAVRRLKRDTKVPVPHGGEHVGAVDDRVRLTV